MWRALRWLVVLALHYSEWLGRKVGPTGMRAISKIISMLLAAIAVAGLGAAVLPGTGHSRSSGARLSAGSRRSARISSCSTSRPK